MLLILVMNFGCSRGSNTRAKFVVTLGSLTAGLTFTGGGLVRVKAPGATKYTTYELTTSNVVELPKGTWEIYFVGFEGATDWSGPYKCGLASPVVLDQDEEELKITVSAANCSANSTYMAMIVEKDPTASGQWDVGNWDTALWAP